MSKANLSSIRYEMQSWDSIEHIWTLAVGYSMFHYVLAVDLAGRNAEAISSFARALRQNNAGDRDATISGISAVRADVRSAEEGLASDLRNAECKSFGNTVSSLTMPLRKELILACSVVC